MLKCLIGKKFNYISRAMDMLCLGIGEDYPFLSRRGKTVRGAEFSLHLQTQWRFTKAETLLLGSRDIYHPYRSDVPEDWEYDLIGRPDNESSVFDVVKKQLEADLENAAITEASVSPLGDVHLVFNGIVFDCFIPSREESEEWRLVDRNADLHTVFYGRYYEIE